MPSFLLNIVGLLRPIDIDQINVCSLSPTDDWKTYFYFFLFLKHMNT